MNEGISVSDATGETEDAGCMLEGACVEDAGSHGQGFSSDVTCSSSREMCYLGDMSGAEAQESTSAALAALEAEVSRMQVRGISGYSCRHVVYGCACLGRGAFYRENIP
jgi:hypothetical protein